MTVSYRFHYFQNQAALFLPPPPASTWTKDPKMVTLKHLVFWPLLCQCFCILHLLFHLPHIISCMVGSFQKILIPQELPFLNNQCQRVPPLNSSHFFLSHYPFFKILSLPVVCHNIIWNFLIIYILLYFLFFKLKNHTYVQKLCLNFWFST